jgi:O-succinylhomoserine sulfhydrylase
VDVSAVCELAHAAGARVVLDNVFATPLLQKPLELGADIVVYSATKHIDGQGRVLGGAILGSREYIDDEVQMLMRHTGPSMSPFNAWVLLKGLETMRLRVEHQSAVALRLARWLEERDGIRSVRFPHLPSHPQYDLAKRQMSGGGSVVTFELDAPAGEGAAKAASFALLDALRIVDISNNLGDAKSLVTHPATTTHRRLTPQARAAAGITDGVVRLSVGLEDAEDLLEDLDQAIGHALTVSAHG